MAIVAETNTDILNQARWEIDVALTAEELPDEILTAGTVLRSANRKVLNSVGLTEAEFDALDDDDVRREVFEEAVIREMAIAVIPRAAQIIMDNENGILTRYQTINWEDRITRLQAENAEALEDYSEDSPYSFFGVTSVTKKEC